MLNSAVIAAFGDGLAAFVLHPATPSTLSANGAREVRAESRWIAGVLRSNLRAHARNKSIWLHGSMLRGGCCCTIYYL